MNDPYKVLNIPNTASDEEVKRAGGNECREDCLYARAPCFKQRRCGSIRREVPFSNILPRQEGLEHQVDRKSVV